jgi:hypothetical protein
MKYLAILHLHVITCNLLFITPLAVFSCPLTALYHSANMLAGNTYETLCCSLSIWMVSGFLPHIYPAIAKYPKEGGNSISVCNIALVAQWSECLFEGWNETALNVPSFPSWSCTVLQVQRQTNGRGRLSHPLEEPLSISLLASDKSCWKMHGTFPLFKCPKQQDSGNFWGAVEGCEPLCQD